MDYSPPLDLKWLSPFHTKGTLSCEIPMFALLCLGYLKMLFSLKKQDDCSKSYCESPVFQHVVGGLTSVGTVCFMGTGS